jgi:hypothetical protein
MPRDEILTETDMGDISDDIAAKSACVLCMEEDLE